MRAITVGLWLALVLSFGVHVFTINMAVDYVTINHGLMPELCIAISAVWVVFQLYLAEFVDHMEAEYLS